MKLAELDNGDMFFCNKFNSGTLCQLLISRGIKIIAFPTTMQGATLGFIDYLTKYDNYEVKVADDIKSILSSIAISKEPL